VRPVVALGELVVRVDSTDGLVGRTIHAANRHLFSFEKIMFKKHLKL
jgi:hypothetical protein